VAVFGSIFPLASLLGQSDSAVAANYRRDSIQYIRDSTAIDSIARIVPIDSLRKLYRALYTAANPRPIAQEVECENFRLSERFGEAATLVRERVHNEVLQSLDRNAEERLSEKMAGAFIEVAGPSCRAVRPTVELPARLRRAPRAPERARSARERVAIRDSLRRSGAVGFEARVSGSSADAELAGFAMMEWRTPKLLAIHLSDLLNYPPSIIALTFERAGAEFLRVGSYPVFARPDLGPPNVFSASLQMPAHNAGSADYDLVSGVLYVDKADTLHATGHFEVRLIGNALHIGRMRRPFGTKTDTVRVVGAFDAKYERRYQDGTFRQWWPNGHPAPMGPAPDYRLNKILTTLNTDASCDSIPGLHGSPFVRHVRDSSSGRWLAGNVAVQFTTDTLGRVYPMSTLIVSWNDTILERGVIVDSARRAPRYQMSNSPGMRYRCRTSLDGPPAGSEQR
jgi:hypothetical protein